MDEETMRNAITDEICKCAFLAGYSEGVPRQAARGCWTKDEITDFAESLGIFEDFEKNRRNCRKGVRIRQGHR